MLEPWVAATLAAAAFQAARFAAQKRLVQAGLSATGATWARFLWAVPVLAPGLALGLWATGTGLPALGLRFWAFALAGGVAQILATICVVALFGLRAFAVGLSFKKSEVLQTAALGWLVLGDRVSATAAGALLAGFAALLVLSKPPAGAAPGTAARAAALGLASGAFFAGAGVGYRGAVLEIAGDPLLQAAVALTMVTAVQTALMSLWFLWRDRAQARRVLAAWRPGLLVGGLSLAGSLGWFIAFAQQSAAYVFALGQVELIFGLVLGRVLFGERPSRSEAAGMALLAASLVWLVAVV